MARTGHPATRQVASVARAISVLDALAEENAAIGTTDIARRTGINASTVSRLLATLVHGGFVEYATDTGRYRLGLRLLQLGNVVLEGLDLRDLARPHLEAIAAVTDETATLSVPGERAAVTVDFVQSPSSVQSVAHVGRPSVAHATATGKVMLAFGGGSLPDGPLGALTPRTITDRAKLAAEVERVRRRGWAQTLGEREPGLNAIAAPVWESRGQLAAILGLQGPGPRFGTRAMRAALEPLLERAGSISAALGADG
ncbi:MAG: IclR family transcriptional regulator [Actinobacteria bacterium]|nr:IclR family transcriptional regulator [Actinomycetota bacterium]